MDRPETVAQFLKAFDVTSDKTLGSGQESDVFAIDDRRVLRLLSASLRRATSGAAGDLLRRARPPRRTVHGSGNY
jgi:hypothetical protein